VGRHILDFNLIMEQVEEMIAVLVDNFHFLEKDPIGVSVLEVLMDVTLFDIVRIFQVIIVLSLVEIELVLLVLILLNLNHIIHQFVLEEYFLVIMEQYLTQIKQRILLV
jgi:hypothetical protein